MYKILWTQRHPSVPHSSSPAKKTHNIYRSSSGVLGLVYLWRPYWSLHTTNHLLAKVFRLPTLNCVLLPSKPRERCIFVWSLHRGVLGVATPMSTLPITRTPSWSQKYTRQALDSSPARIQANLLWFVEDVSSRGRRGLDCTQLPPFSPCCRSPAPPSGQTPPGPCYKQGW